MAQETALVVREPIHIRKARVADAEAIAHVNVVTWQVTYRGLVPDAILDGLSIAERRDRWEAIIARPRQGSAVLVAETSAEEVVGYVAGGPERNGNAPYAGELYALYVLPAWQKQGIGKRLVKEAVVHLRKTGCKNMLVWFVQGNPVAHFYARLGGRYVKDGSFDIKGVTIHETAYGWDRLDSLHAHLTHRASHSD